MTSKKSFSVENPYALFNAINRLEASVSEDTLRKAASAGITEFVNEVRIRTPRESGDLVAGLAAAYIAEDSVTGKIATYRLLFVGDTKPKGPKDKIVSRRALAGWLENGTSGMAARPFVRPSFEAAKARAIEKTNEVIAAAVNAKG